MTVSTSDEYEFCPRFFGLTAGSLNESANAMIVSALANCEQEFLSLAKLNQLLGLTRHSPVSEGFFRHYFLSAPMEHPYAIGRLMSVQPEVHVSHIVSRAQFEFGVRRFLADALLFFPDIDQAFQELGEKTHEQIISFFSSKCFDGQSMQQRGPAFELQKIPIDDRYLISELACKAYSLDESPDPAVLTELLKAYTQLHPGDKIPLKRLVDRAVTSASDYQLALSLPVSTEEVENEMVGSETEIREVVGRVLERFKSARTAASKNTQLYLSGAKDLDVYVATSMRRRDDFRDMAQNCEMIFSDPRLRPFHLRYFDPTLSAARGHEEKGLLECIMVDSAKVVIYFAQERESWGKDIEAARGLMQGKPVIIYTPSTPAGHERLLFFRDIHPLSRLVDIKTGVVVGAIITDDIAKVIQLLVRIFSNKMEYVVEQTPLGNLRLKEYLTKSIVRLATSDEMLDWSLKQYYTK
jgi:hypothetical protein